MNYNDEKEICKKGSILIRVESKIKKRDKKEEEKSGVKPKAVILVHDDLIEKP